MYPVSLRNRLIYPLGELEPVPSYIESRPNQFSTHPNASVPTVYFYYTSVLSKNIDTTTMLLLSIILVKVKMSEREGTMGCILH